MVLYGILPCAVLLLAFLGLLFRYRASLSKGWSAWLDRHGKTPGMLPLAMGGGGIAFAHLLGLVLPDWMKALTASPLRLLIVEVLGLILGLLLLYGFVRFLASRLSALWSEGPGGRAWAVVYGLLFLEILSGLDTAASLRWGSAWYVAVVVPYLRSLLALTPETALMAQLPLTVRLHFLVSIALVVSIPIAHAIGRSSRADAARLSPPENAPGSAGVRP